ncbi:MAG: hypothetical protein JSU68_14105 [Phycisphaerales bacterium]|nr:MAG: hypothetical protein JSU68_14105 [Phycisphaerales bacterium]
MKRAACLPNRTCFAAGSLAALLLAAVSVACRRADTSNQTVAPPPPEPLPSTWVDTAAADARPAAALDEPDEADSQVYEQADSGVPEFDATDVAPWPNVREGQWACYEMLDGFSQRLTVNHLGEGEVELTMEMFCAGQPAGLPAPRIENRRELSPLAESRFHRATITFAPDRISVAGREWLCVRATARWDDEGLAYEQRSWFSDQAPLSGLVLQETVQGKQPVARTRLSVYGDDEPREAGCP